MAKHEHPQAPAEIFYPPGHPKHRARPVPPGVKPPTPAQVEQAAERASAPDTYTPEEPKDLGDIIRAIGDLASELHEQFFAVPDVVDGTGRVDPEKFDTATQHAFIACGNALDYAIRLVSEKGRAGRIKNLRAQLAEEMRAAGLTGDPGESDTLKGGRQD